PPAGQPATPAETLDLDAIEARADAATPGPWHGEHEQYEGRELLCVSIGDYGWVCSGERSPEYDIDSEQGKADAEFIAHARTEVPALVAEVRGLRAELERMRRAWWKMQAFRDKNADGMIAEIMRLRAELKTARATDPAGPAAPTTPREVAEQLRWAMIGQHQAAGHRLSVFAFGEECKPCQRAADECDGDLVCEPARKWQAEYEAAMMLPLSTVPPDGTEADHA
ncbi:MAG TPA: hypothetical protein VGW74_14705, partial [Propionibacteriaceae bacterium]|nr:hypothetical protein [Propionibacteriaceae bacterium]